MASHDWDPDLYNRYGAERARPFHDLLALLPPALGGRWVDLGCGDGAHAREAAVRLGASEVVGLDLSEAMLARARAAPVAPGGPRFTWRRASIEAFAGGDEGPFDLVLAHASLHWVADHAALLPRLLDKVAPSGWFAAQMPINHTAPTHALLEKVARSPPFRDAFDGFERAYPQRKVRFYRRALERSGASHLVVEARTYRHPMPGPEAIATFVRATAMRPYLARLAAGRREAFEAAYARALDPAYPPCDAAGTRLLDCRRLLMVGRL